MIFVHVPKNMNEWLGYWTGKDWILVEILSPEDQEPGILPKIIRTTELPALPFPSPVSFALFAEIEKKFYVVQAFDKRGFPVIMSLQDISHEFPFPVLPRNIQPVESGGSTYAFDYTTWFMIVN